MLPQVWDIAQLKTVYNLLQNNHTLYIFQCKNYILVTHERIFKCLFKLFQSESENRHQSQLEISDIVIKDPLAT